MIAATQESAAIADHASAEIDIVVFTMEAAAVQDLVAAGISVEAALVVLAPLASKGTSAPNQKGPLSGKE